MKLLSDQNFAIRLESDGGFLTKDHAMLLRKAWSNEPISEIRVTSDDRICSDPFIVDVVLTQIKPYLNYVQKDDFIETGVLSRTIHYIIDTKNSEENSKKHDISQSIQKDIYETLNRIFIFSSRANDNLILKLDSHAEEKFSSILKENTKSLEDNNADLITRYGECVLRIAALLHISESDDSINDTIDFSSINTAGEIMKIFYNHAIYSRNYVSHESLKCAKLIGNYMLDQSNNGSKEFLITDLKQKYKYKYDSNTVEEALKKLINLKVIRRIRNKSDNPKGGRPKSDMISVNIGYSKVAND